MTNTRSQAERTAGTRGALVAAARPIFAAKGYAAVGTDELAAAAGVTRGALYHQFGGKEGLFVAVFREVQHEIVQRFAQGALSLGTTAHPLEALHRDLDAWLAACAEPEVHRIVLIEAPAALGWERWREVGREYGVGLVETVVQRLVDQAVIPAQPARPLAHVLVGALEEAALYAARADDRAVGTAEVRAALVALVDGLATR